MASRYLLATRSTGNADSAVIVALGSQSELLMEYDLHGRYAQMAQL